MSNRKDINLYWNMMHRCYKTEYETYINYGGRGIKVCNEWINSKEIFINYIKSIPNYGLTGYTFDRIDNDKNYEPGNVQFATRQFQNNNRRKSKVNKTGYTGVSFQGNLIRSVIFINGKRKHLGYFPSVEEALNARNNYIYENGLEQFGYKIQPFIN